MLTPDKKPTPKFDVLYYTAVDGRRFGWEVGAVNIVLISLFLNQPFYPLPWWALAITINIALVRWLLLMHELFHIQSHADAHPLIRLLLVPFTPVNIGYAEYRQLHMGHHRYAATADDPDAFHIRGGHLRSLLGALFFPEVSTLKCLADPEIRINGPELMMRLALFVGLAWLGGAAFWSVWVWLRINYMISIWVFFHHLHYRGGAYGTFALPLPGVLASVLKRVYGKPVFYATIHHDVHHRYPKVAAVNLPALADEWRRDSQ